MKKVCFSLFFAVLFLSAVIGIKAQSQVSAFTGNWMLDREKTNTTKNFPERMKNYKMVVSGTDSVLNVRSQVDGNVEIQSEGHGVLTPRMESASILGRQTAKEPEPSSVNAGAAKINYGGTMAVYFTPKNATYNINGEEVKIETPDGLVRIKAKPDKSGKTLQFTTIRRMRMQKGEIEVTTREVWKLSDDGKSLKLQRTVETPTSRDDVTMILTKIG